MIKRLLYHLDWLGLFLVFTGYVLFAFDINIYLFLLLNMIGTLLIVIYTYVQKLAALFLLNLFIFLVLLFKFIKMVLNNA